VLDLTGHDIGAVAPLGSLTIPPAGTVLHLIGLPEYRDREGRWTTAVVMGPDRSGEWLQVDASNAHSSWVEYGFSGGAAVDRDSGLVVGIVTRANNNPAARNAWVIPLATVALYWPPLASLASSRLTADTGYRDFRRAFDSRRYADALHCLSSVQSRFPDESEVYYYWAMAALGGHRPASHSAETVDGVQRLLRQALRLDPRSIRAAALLAMVQEDFFTLRHLPLPNPSTRQPVAYARLDAADARELVDHVPANDCASWRAIHQRSRT
jgi:hypothetical protein